MTKDDRKHQPLISRCSCLDAWLIFEIPPVKCWVWIGGCTIKWQSISFSSINFFSHSPGWSKMNLCSPWSISWLMKTEGSMLSPAQHGSSITPESPFLSLFTCCLNSYSEAKGNLLWTSLSAEIHSHFAHMYSTTQTQTQSFLLHGCSNTACNVKYMKFTFVLIRITWYRNKLKHQTTTPKHYCNTQLKWLGQLVSGSTMAVAKFNSNTVWNHSSLHMLCYILWVTHQVHGTSLLWSGGSSSSIDPNSYIKLFSHCILKVC